MCECEWVCTDEGLPGEIYVCMYVLSKVSCDIKKWRLRNFAALFLYLSGSNNWDLHVIDVQY